MRNQLSCAWICAAASLALLASCSMPIDVERVTDSTQPTKGIRFRMKRPVFEVQLRYDPGEAFEPTPSEAPDEELSEQDEVREGEAAADPGAADGGAQDEASDSEGTAEPNKYTVFLVQKMVPGETYEATVDGRIFSDTEASLTIDDEGYLSAASAGETDRLSDFLVEVAGLAVAVGFGPAATSGHPDEKALSAYTKDHEALLQYRANLRAALRDARNKFPSAGATKEQVEVLAQLEEEYAEVDKKVADHRFTVPRKRVYLDYKNAKGKVDALPGNGESHEAWLHLTIERARS